MVAKETILSILWLINSWKKKDLGGRNQTKNISYRTCSPTSEWWCYMFAVCLCAYLNLQSPMANNKTHQFFPFLFLIPLPMCMPVVSNSPAFYLCYYLLTHYTYCIIRVKYLYFMQNLTCDSVKIYYSWDLYDIYQKKSAIFFYILGKKIIL